MTTVKYGEMSWTDNSLNVGSDKKTVNKDLFLRLSEGDNELRLITQPHQYLVHKYKKDPTNPKDFGQKIRCSIIHGSCAVCELNDVAKPRWLFGVIDRKTGASKILDVGSAVLQQLKKWVSNTKFGDPTKYDINVVVDKRGGPAGYYTVQAYPKEPLSAEDQKVRDSFDMEELKRLTTPLTPEKVQERMSKINGGDTNGHSTTRTATTTPTVNVTDDEDLNEAFPAYNGNTASA